ncbi:MAG: beta-propeller domain-containing protein [Nitrospirae bacterium]|nr:beta-propeller domain-containing protein [Nitrospirota bacterium]
MIVITRIASVVIILTLTAGCGSIRTGGDGTSVNTNGLVKNRLYKYSLARFASSATMETYLKEAIKKQSLESSSSGGILTDTQTMTMTGGVSGQEGASSPDRSQAVYSTTILQESGVDEADLIKSDGRHLYMAVKSPYPYYGFMERMMAPVMTDGTGGSSGGEDPGQAYANKIRVMKLSDSPPDASEVAVISLPTSSIVDSLYLVTNRGDGHSDLLAVIGTGSGTPMDSWFEPWYWRNGKTALELFNVSDPAKPSGVISLEIDGYLISSRRIGETLYIVSRYTPYIEGYLPYPLTEKEKQDNAVLLAGTSLSDLLPDITINGEEKGDLITPEKCYLPPMPEDAVTTPDIITITAIDLASPQTPRSSCIVGQAEAIYVSPQALYLATTRYRYSPMPLSGDVAVGAPAVAGMTVSYMSPEVETDLHKFSLDASQTVYSGSGVVPGHLGWEQDKKSFRMGEKDGYLRIATSLGETWDLSAKTMLMVLKESGPAGEERLAEVSRLPNNAHREPIGKPGERLYAARFLGDRAYLVTFRVTDPLYVIDLKDPADPRLAGELKISGYSDYLQPVGENRLLGIGKDAVPDETGGWGDGRGAWYQGVKLSLFDVLDPANPREVDSRVIGKRGTDSDALIDHHAFAYIPPLDGKPARLALPVRLHDTANSDLSGNPWDYYDWTHTGLYLFDIDLEGDNGITLSGQLIAEERSAEKTYDYGYGYDRALILNDSAHFIHEGKVWSASWVSATSPISAAPRRR